MRVREGLLRGTDAGGYAWEMLISALDEGGKCSSLVSMADQIGLGILISIADQIAAPKTTEAFPKSSFLVLTIFGNINSQGSQGSKRGHATLSDT